MVPLNRACDDNAATGWVYDWEEPNATHGLFYTGGITGDVRVTGTPGTYIACESLPKNWVYTAAYLDDPGQTTNLVTNTTDDFTCVTVTINAINGESHTILFGNVQRRYTKIVLTCDETDNT